MESNQRGRCFIVRSLLIVRDEHGFVFEIANSDRKNSRKIQRFLNLILNQRISGLDLSLIHHHDDIMCNGE
jgi:hypothetical protein